MGNFAMNLKNFWIRILLFHFLTVDKSEEVTIYEIRKVVFLSRAEQMGSFNEHKNKCLQRMAEAHTEQGVYCSIVWDNIMCWNRTPAGTLAKQSCPDYVNGLSKSGYATRECLQNGTWKPNYEYNATNGWTNYSACIGGKQELNDLSVHLSRIQLMSEVGYGISLASLIIAVLIMLLSRRLHCKSNSLHINLFIAFILRASVSFVKNTLFEEGVGLEKDITRDADGQIKFIKEGSHWECKLLMTVFLYTVSASLMWIFMEGLYLHMLVYRTLWTERSGIKLYVVLGWTTPLLYIIPWVLVRIYLENDLCWNTFGHAYHWIYKGPIIITVMINFVFFIDIVRVLCIRVKTHRQIQGSKQQLRKLAKFSLVLIPLFGVIYIGFAAYPQGVSVQADILYLYCEMFYNSFQGFILALLFCFLNEEVNIYIRKWIFQRAYPRKTSNMRSTTKSGAAGLDDGTMGLIPGSSFSNRGERIPMCCNVKVDKHKGNQGPTGRLSCMSTQSTRDKNENNKVRFTTKFVNKGVESNTPKPNVDYRSIEERSLSNTSFS